MAAKSHNHTLAGLRILAVGKTVATRIAASWLAECGAQVRLQDAPDTSESATFSAQTSRMLAADVDGGFDAVIGDADALDAADLAGCDRATRVAITSPLPATGDYTDALLDAGRLDSTESSHCHKSEISSFRSTSGSNAVAKVIASSVKPRTCPPPHGAPARPSRPLAPTTQL